jgi:hypothetical protein
MLNPFNPLRFILCRRTAAAPKEPETAKGLKESGSDHPDLLPLPRSQGAAKADPGLQTAPGRNAMVPRPSDNASMLPSWRPARVASRSMRDTLRLQDSRLDDSDADDDKPTLLSILIQDNAKRLGRDLSLSALCHCRRTERAKSSSPSVPVSRSLASETKQKMLSGRASQAGDSANTAHTILKTLEKDNALRAALASKSAATTTGSTSETAVPPLGHRHAPASFHIPSAA